MHFLQRLTPDDISSMALPFDEPDRTLPAHLSAPYRSLTLPRDLMTLYARTGKLDKIDDY